MHNYDRHDINLRDVRNGELVVSYNCIDRSNRSHVSGRHVSSRLPLACLTLFTDGTLAVDTLTDEERAWIASESAARSNQIDFAGTNA